MKLQKNKRKVNLSGRNTFSKNKIIIGSRGSTLALWQSSFVKKELQRKNKNLRIEINIIKTTGDKILDVALSKIGDKSLFTKELENALLNKEIDLAVHSLKDLQTQIPNGLKLSAVSKRHSVEDVLISGKKGITLQSLKENAVIATGSLRRKCQLLHVRPDIKIVELRGNVPTRIQKFLKSDWDGIILARAGVERLKLQKYISSFISTEEILPAVGQGVLGIEINEENELVNEILQIIHDEPTYKAILAEREFLRTLKGGCQVPIGAFAQLKSNGIYLDAMIGSIDGVLSFRKNMRGSKNDPEKLGRLLAKDFLKAGAGEILNEIYNTIGKK
jgi:hydroxymethylbilane synthase